MKKMIKVALAVMLVLIAVTACQPQYVFYDPDMLPGHGGTKYTEAKSPEEFKKLIESGTPVSVPATDDPDEKYTLPANLAKAVFIKGAEAGAKVYIPVTGASGNNGYNLPAGSKLEDIEVVFSKDVSTYAVNRAEGEEGATTDPEPQFAMVISGNGTTISDVNFVFPDDESLSGICIWNAGNVSISDVEFKGFPARAPFNISGSTVKFSGTIDTEEGSGWYPNQTVIQINGVGSNHEASKVTFSKVTGIDAVWQEVIEGTYGSTQIADFSKPVGSSVTGLSGYYNIYADRGDTRGWMWLSEDLAKTALPIFLASPAHDRFFNVLNDEGSYVSQVTVIRPAALSENLKYSVDLDEFEYLSLPTKLAAAVKAVANSDNLSVTFSGTKETEAEKDVVTATKWSMTGDVELVLTVSEAMFGGDASETITARVTASMNGFSGIFSDSTKGTEAKNPAKFVVEEDKVVADIAGNKDPNKENNPAFCLATGLEGSLSINGVSVNLTTLMEAAKAFDISGLMGQLGQ